MRSATCAKLMLGLQLQAFVKAWLIDGFQVDEALAIRGARRDVVRAALRQETAEAYCPMMYELRIYEAAPGRMPDLNSRFENYNPQDMGTVRHRAGRLSGWPKSGRAANSGTC